MSGKGEKVEMIVTMKRCDGNRNNQIHFLDSPYPFNPKQQEK